GVPCQKKASNTKRQGARQPTVQCDPSIKFKRTRSPTGTTPLKNKRLLTSRNNPWTVEEVEVLLELAAETMCHSKSFWQKSADTVNPLFCTSRSGSSCRLEFLRQQKQGRAIYVRPGSANIECQTEPTIPVIPLKENTTVCDPEQCEADGTEGTTGAKILHCLHHCTAGHSEEVKTTSVTKMLHVLLNKGTYSDLANAAKSDEALLESFLNIVHLPQIKADAKHITEKQRSILAQKDFTSMCDFQWKLILQEMEGHAKILAQVILAFMVPPKHEDDLKYMERLVPPVAFIYSICMKQRCKDLSLVQRLIAMVLTDRQVHQEVFDRLQPLGVCLSHKVTSVVVADVEKHLKDTLVDALKKGKKFRLVTDNVNFMVSPSHLRLTMNKQHMENCFGGAAIIQNISFQHLSDVTPQQVLISVPWQHFLPQQQDWNDLKAEYVVLIMRVLVKHMKAFKPFKGCLEAITGDYNDSLKHKHEVIPLPVLRKNEMKNTDVIDILDYYEEFISSLYQEAGLEFDDSTRVHIGGDQLTRERFSSAKRLRAQGDSPMNRFSHLSPVTFELFHLQMCLLAVMYQRLYSEKSTESGTLGAERTRLGRQRADGNKVKDNFRDCSELALSLTDAYIVEVACHFFGMETCHDVPTKHLPEQPPESLSQEEQRKWMADACGKLIDTFVWNSTMVHLAQEDGMTSPKPVSKEVRVVMPDGSERTIQLAVDTPQRSTTSQSQQRDGSTVYACNVLELGMLYKELQDAIQVPNRPRMLRILKYHDGSERAQQKQQVCTGNPAIFVPPAGNTQ
ncbi:hypothetical protein BaRGS_00030211, partial [Batillaria attramentaria]